MSEPALEIQDLVKRYRDVTALDGVALTIAPGEIFALLGPNGAGKTTLIGAVCGLVLKTSGRVRVFGTDLDADPLRPRFDIGLVPQEINFDPFFSVAESLRIQQGYYGQRPDDARIEELLAALNLTAKRNAQTRTLSGGMKRRLLIAKALVHRPKLVFLDEPTAGVDVELRRDLWTYVLKLRAQGTTVILTTHYLEEAEQLADRVGVIDHGRLLVVEEKTSLMSRLGEKVLAVSLASPAPPMPELTQPGMQLSGDRLQLTYTERTGSAPMAQVLQSLYANGLAIREVETRRSRLEDVLLQILRAPQGEPAA